MSQWETFLDQARRSNANIRFRDLCRLVERLGYVERRHAGSHHIYKHPTRTDLPMLNLQMGRGGKAKPYQVKQVLAVIDDYGLEVT